MGTTLLQTESGEVQLLAQLVDNKCQTLAASKKYVQPLFVIYESK